MTLPGTEGPALVVRHTRQVFPLGGSPITIGGQEDNTIILADPEVSPLHAIVSWQAGAFTVADAGSAGGTFLDERRLRGPRPLRHGSVLRIGQTLFDVQIPPEEGIPEARAAAPGQLAPPPSLRRGRFSGPVIAGVLLGAFVLACVVTAAALLLLDQQRGRPDVTLLSPRQDAQVAVGESLLLQASATGTRDITRLELSVDGAVVGSADSAGEEGQATLTASQPWVFDRPGAHVVAATAYTSRKRSGTTVSHQVLVVDLSARLTPNPSPGTPPAETPTATASPTSTETPTPVPTGTPVVLPLPVIEFFRANPATIDLGACTMLEWGQVSYAVAATIDHGIGGVATPGSRQVCPSETTAYLLSASGPGGVTSLSVTVTVRGGRPDLLAERVEFAPYPPVQGEDVRVEIWIRNAGNAAASPFAWDWQPGSSGAFHGTVQVNLGAGESVAVSLTWRPDAAYTELLTVARVDSGGVVAESDETNNELRQTIRVVAPSSTLVLWSQAALDGTVFGGQGASTSAEIRVGNTPSATESVDRGFLSFDLLSFPQDATIQSVELRFYQVNVVGRPYQKLGRLLLSHVDYGSSLDASDFDVPALGSATLPKENRPGSWYSISGELLDSWLAYARSSGLERFQFRLQFEVEADEDTEPDYLQVESGDNALGTGNLPELIVTYSVP